MKLIFLKPGKYKSGREVIIVMPNDVESKKVFDVEDKNAVNFIKVEKAKLAEIKSVKQKEPAKK